MFTFLCRNSSSTKSTSSSFFLWVTNHNCTSYKLSLLLVVVQYKLSWLPEFFHLDGEIPSRMGKYPMLRTNTKPNQLITHAKIYSIVSLVYISRIFVPNLPKYSKPSASRLRYSEYIPQKVRTVLVRYLLSEICILVYSWTGCLTSKIYYICITDR